MKVTVEGKANGVQMEIEIPDYVSVEDAEEIVELLQNIADRYDSAKELNDELTRAARQLGLDVWRTH